MDTPFPNRRWLVIPATLVETIDFSQVLESSKEALRYSVDGLKTFVKYEIREVKESYTLTMNSLPGEEPTLTTVTAGIYGRPSIYSEEYPEYNHQEILALLATEEWTKPMDNII